MQPLEALIHEMFQRPSGVLPMKIVYVEARRMYYWFAFEVKKEIPP
jgi:hypothetical protein